MNYIVMVEEYQSYESDTMSYENGATYLFDPPVVTDSNKVETMSAVVQVAINERVFDRDLPEQ